MEAAGAGAGAGAAPEEKRGEKRPRGRPSNLAKAQAAAAKPAGGMRQLTLTMAHTLIIKNGPAIFVQMAPGAAGAEAVAAAVADGLRAQIARAPGAAEVGPAAAVPVPAAPAVPAAAAAGGAGVHLPVAPDGDGAGDGEPADEEILDLLHDDSEDEEHAPPAAAAPGAAPAIVDGALHRNQYTDEDVAKILAKVQESPTIAEGLRSINAIPGWEKVGRANVRRWLKIAAAAAADPDAEPVAKGRPVNASFEKAVVNNLMFAIVSEVYGEEQLQVVANTAYSYETIRSAAKLVQAEPEWSDVPGVQNLKFSDDWVHSFLERNGLRRLRVTTTPKAPEPVAKVQARMAEIQKQIVDG
jgi:hypothetical protein